MQHYHTFLSLGDSYTIGESLPLNESFPYQTVSLLRKADKPFSAPEVIAKTGWTTTELLEGIAQHTLLPKYDFVTLLIGVNNQYRGWSIIQYGEEFEKLVKQVIALTGGKPERVVVLSIPDYSITPFAEAFSRRGIHEGVNEFNTFNKELSVHYKTAYLDITQSTRAAENDETLLAADGLHPSAKEYKKWAERLAEKFLQALKH